MCVWGVMWGVWLVVECSWRFFSGTCSRRRAAAMGCDRCGLIMCVMMMWFNGKGSCCWRCWLCDGVDYCLRCCWWGRVGSGIRSCVKSWWRCWFRWADLWWWRCWFCVGCRIWVFELCFFCFWCYLLWCCLWWSWEWRRRFGWEGICRRNKSFYAGVIRGKILWSLFFYLWWWWLGWSWVMRWWYLFFFGWCVLKSVMCCVIGCRRVSTSKMKSRWFFDRAFWWIWWLCDWVYWGWECWCDC